MDDENYLDAPFGRFAERQKARDARRADRAARRAGSALRFAPGHGIAGLVLATVSLIGIGPAELLGQSLIYRHDDIRGLAVGPAIAALVAFAGGWLGRRQLQTAELPWMRSLGFAAVVVAAFAFVINFSAFIGVLTAS